MEYFKELDTAVYQGRFVFTQTDAGGGNTVFNIYTGNGTRLIIDYFNVRLSKSSGTSTQYYMLLDNGGNLLTYLLRDITLSNGQQLNFPVSIGNNLAANNTSGMQKIILVNGDTLQLYSASLAQNDNITVTIRGRIRGKSPVVDSSASSGSVSISTTHARIV